MKVRKREAEKMQVQKQRAKTVGTKLTFSEYEKAQNLVDAGLYLNISDFIRASVREKLDSIEVVKLRDIDYKTAKKEVLGYYEKYSEAYPSDIGNELGIDLRTVYQIVDELIKEKRVEYIK